MADNRISGVRVKKTIWDIRVKLRFCNQNNVNVASIQNVMKLRQLIAQTLSIEHVNTIFNGHFLILAGLALAVSPKVSGKPFGTVAGIHQTLQICGGVSRVLKLHITVCDSWLYNLAVLLKLNSDSILHSFTGGLFVEISSLWVIIFFLATQITLWKH